MQDGHSIVRTDVTFVISFVMSYGMEAWAFYSIFWYYVCRELFCPCVKPTSDVLDVRKFVLKFLHHLNGKLRVIPKPADYENTFVSGDMRKTCARIVDEIGKRNV